MITAQNLATAKIDFSKLPAKFKQDFADVVEMAPYIDNEPDLRQVVNGYVAELNKQLAKKKPAAKAKAKTAAKKKAPAKRSQSNEEAVKAKKDYEAAKADAVAGKFANLSRAEILALAQQVHAKRKLSAQILDEAVDHKKRLSPTPENLVRWMKEPGKYDLIGIDTYRKDDPTADLKIKKEIFWHRLLKK